MSSGLMLQTTRRHIRIPAERPRWVVSPNSMINPGIRARSAIIPTEKYAKEKIGLSRCTLSKNAKSDKCLVGVVEKSSQHQI